jgi:hypothetical protein
MRFARIVFMSAAILGFAILLPLYFTLNWTSEHHPPAITHPEFYFSAVTVGVVWQFAFLLIASDPIRYRPLMPIAMLEKFGFVATLAVLVLLHQVPLQAALVSLFDLALGIFFVAAWLRTPKHIPTP